MESLLLSSLFQNKIKKKKEEDEINK